MGSYCEVDGYLLHKNKIIEENFGQLVVFKCMRNEVLLLAHTSVFNNSIGPKQVMERIKYSFFGMVGEYMPNFCGSCNECRLTRAVKTKGRTPITPLMKPELLFQVINVDPSDRSP
ncbi:retrovirus-related Pol polyprotein from transposon opus [Nephila pilipes]|uniref:Retrovirus-related Pol polyprotein from transposon opus n=1 Tax=Nephila pilipes TaxID=299642 RepID=A0A8X6MEJ4_NEPPI|nr:retrovirus-related Pol polyprotein from transposon opus [Nephila pilipes]